MLTVTPLEDFRAYFQHTDISKEAIGKLAPVLDSSGIMILLQGRYKIQYSAVH